MAKFKPGIPDSFSLDVEPVRDLGDYLDEPRPTPVVPKKEREETQATPSQPPAVPAPEPVVVSQPVAQPPTPVVTAPVTQPVTAAVVPPLMTPANTVPEYIEPQREERGGKEKAPRREISMTPEALRMSDELLEVIRNGSGQRDTKANELMHALVLLAYDVIDNIDPHTIPKRGRWGTPTARAYPFELRNAFLRALLEKYGQDANGVGGVKFPVNSAA